MALEIATDALEDEVAERESKLLKLVEELSLFSRQLKTGSKLNIFDAVGLHRQEIKHSNFLAFLLRPNESHGLGDRFLKGVLRKIFENLDEPPLSSLEFELADFEDALVSREWKNIDILIESRSNHLAIAVENKIDSSEGKNQLLTYEEAVSVLFPAHKSVFVYLTLEGDPPSSNVWSSLSYSDVIEVLIEAKSSKEGQCTPEAKLVIEQYIEMMRRNVVPDQTLVVQCRKIYQKHKHALDLIYRYGEVNAFEAAANQFFEERPDLKLFAITSGRVAFLPNELVEIVPEMRGVTYFGQQRPLAFWFYLGSDDKFGFAIEVGPFAGDSFSREVLVQRLQQLFGNKAKIYPKYTRVISKYQKLTEERAGDAQILKDEMNKYYNEASPHLAGLVFVLREFFVAPT